MKKALILIDYINDIVHPKGKTPGCAKMFAENDLLNKANSLLKHARRNDWLIVWVKVCFTQDYVEVGPYSPVFNAAKKFKAYQIGSWGAELIEGLDFQEGDCVVLKNRINAFYNTNLDLLLRANQIEELYIGGVSTEMAIQATSRDAHDRDYKVNIISDLCANATKELHDASLAMLGRIATIANSTDLN